MFSATDDIPRADEVKTLIKDIWDLRMAKLRSSIDVFVKSDATYAKVRMANTYSSVFLYVIVISHSKTEVTAPLLCNCSLFSVEFQTTDIFGDFQAEMWDRVQNGERVSKNKNIKKTVSVMLTTCKIYMK